MHYQVPVLGTRVLPLAVVFGFEVVELEVSTYVRTGIGMVLPGLLGWGQLPGRCTQ